MSKEISKELLNQVKKELEKENIQKQEEINNCAKEIDEILKKYNCTMQVINQIKINKND